MLLKAMAKALLQIKILFQGNFFLKQQICACVLRTFLRHLLAITSGNVLNSHQCLGAKHCESVGDELGYMTYILSQISQDDRLL